MLVKSHRPDLDVSASDDLSAAARARRKAIRSAGFLALALTALNAALLTGVFGGHRTFVPTLGDRGPASTELASLSAAENSNAELILSCKSVPDSIVVVSARSLRFRLTGCLNSATVGGPLPQLQNETNGHEATLFLVERRELESDLVPLSEGLNALVLTGGDGQRRSWSVSTAATSENQKPQPAPNK